MIPLVQYQLTIQYLTRSQVTRVDDYTQRNMVNHVELFEDYKKAKKESRLLLQKINPEDIVVAKIEPVLLREDLVG